MSGLLPVFVSVEGARIVVTGTGPAARDVAVRLEGLGARVERVEGAGSASILDGALMLVTASDEPDADASLLQAACERGLLAVSALGPSGRAFLGACEERGDVAVAVATRGQAPPLESRLAADAMKAVGPETEAFARILGSIRRKLEERIPDDSIRNAIWVQILDSPVSLLLQSGSDDEALEMAERMAWGTG